MSSEAQHPLIEPLTEREEDVLNLLVEGKTNREIAEELVLSMNTVKWYNRQIYGKLGVENREGLAEKVRELGLVEKDELEERPKYNLPHPATPLLGRERELEDLEKLLLDGRTRIISIIGPGGMGKTRLAIELAQRLNGRFADGAAFVPLAPLQSEESVVPAIAQSLRFTFQGGGLDEKTQLLNFLREKKLLIVLDNYEHLIDSAPLLAEIAEAAPDLKMVVTSREKLKLQIEQLYPLQSLPLMDWGTVEQAAKDPAVQLFLEYGRRIRPSFELQPEDLDALHQILQLVDGMPLAIILAACWLELFSPAEIATEILKSLDFLEADYRDLPERQRSMRAVFDASWGQLNEQEQKLFAALSVFRGGFSLEAAREVAAASPKVLLKLVGRSLLNRSTFEHFDIHEMIRQFAADELARISGQEQLTRKRHSTYYCNFLKQREDAIFGPNSEEQIAEIANNFENIRLAWKWAVDNESDLVYKALSAYGIFMKRQSRYEEGESALRYADNGKSKWINLDSRCMAELLIWRSDFVRFRSPDLFDELIQRIEDYLTQADSKGLDTLRERAFFFRFKTKDRTQDPKTRTKLLEESLSLYQEVGRFLELWWNFNDLGFAYINQAKYPKALDYFSQALRLCEQANDQRFIASTMMFIAYCKAGMGRVMEGESEIQKALELAETSGYELSKAEWQQRLAEIKVMSGHFDEGRSTFDKSRELWEKNGNFFYAQMIDIRQCWAILHLGHYREVVTISESIINNNQIPLFERGLASFFWGCALLVNENLEEARFHLLESEKFFQTIHQLDEGTWASGILGYIALEEKDKNKCQKYLIEAFRPNLFLPSILSLPVIALMLAESDYLERSTELYTLACTYEFVANSHWFQDVFGRKIDILTASLPPETAAAAQERGRGLDFWQTAESLLQELINLEQ